VSAGLTTLRVTLRESCGRVCGSRELPTGHRDRPWYFVGSVALWCGKWATIHDFEGGPAIFLLAHEVDAVMRGEL
jgi:hypothetical protein